MSENAIIIANPKAVIFKSEALNAVTVEINGYITEVQQKAHANHIAISKALARVNTEELYKEDGFKTALEYAMETFGWKRANAYAMMQVGAKLNANELPEGDFSVSQYREMLPLSKEEAAEAVESGIISEGMSAKEIREEVQSLKPKAERKAKAEKVYKWYQDNVPGRKDLEMAESAFVEGEGTDGTQRVKFGEMLGYLVNMGGEIHFFVKGEEVKEVVDAEAVTEEPKN